VWSHSHCEKVMGKAQLGAVVPSLVGVKIERRAAESNKCTSVVPSIDNV